MDLLRIEPNERPFIRAGAKLFFAAGWPSNYFDLGMSLAAGKGLPPQPYESFASKRQYQERMRGAGFYVPKSAL